MTNENTIDTSATTVLAAAPRVLTKAEKLERIEVQIKNLIQKRYNIENDIVTTKAAKVVILPEVGATITFQHGRRTPTTAPVLLSGVVVAVKPVGTGTDGKRTPAQLKVQVGEGFDASFVVIYPAQIVAEGEEETTDGEEDYTDGGVTQE